MPELQHGILPMLQLNRNLQLKVLEELSEAYPEDFDFAESGLKDIPDLQANLFYLAEHNLIESNTITQEWASPQKMLTARITARGLDFLADDGGLGAILNVITVRLEADTILSLIESKIQESALPFDKKEGAISRLRGFSGDVLKSVIIKLLEKAIENPEQIINLISLG